MDPIDFVILASSVLGAVGLLRRGAGPVSQAGRAVTRAGFSAAVPIRRGAQHLPWPFRPVATGVLTFSTVILTGQAALVADGASTLVEAASVPRRRPAAQPKATSSQPAARKPKTPRPSVRTDAPSKATPRGSSGATRGGGRASTPGTKPRRAKRGSIRSTARKAPPRSATSKRSSSIQKTQSARTGRSSLR
jgi:hypothetical protein